MKEVKTQILMEEAERIARMAGGFLKEKFYQGVSSTMKGPSDIVTEADYASEKLIIAEIKKKFPDHSILAEESGEEKKDSIYQWVVDPLDGTVNFSLGIPIFGVIITLVKNGEPIVGVHYLPVIQELYSAEKNKGAFLNGKPIRVSERKELKQMIIGLGDFNIGKDQAMRNLDNEMLKRIIGALSHETMRTKQMGAACMDLAMVASGKIDALFYAFSNPWDVLAGRLMIEEAGGQIIQSGDLTLYGSGVNTKEILEKIPFSTL